MAGTDHSKGNFDFIRTCPPFHNEGQKRRFLCEDERRMLRLVTALPVIVSLRPLLWYKEVVVIFLAGREARREFCSPVLTL